MGHKNVKYVVGGGNYNSQVAKLRNLHLETFGRLNSYPPFRLDYKK